MSARASDSGGELAARLRTQAEHCANGGSPLYAGLLERAAADVEAGGAVARLLHGHESDSADSVLPLRMMGAVHRRVLEGELPELGSCYAQGAVAEDVWPVFRKALGDDEGALCRLLDRPVQTNEVGRCAGLLPGFLIVAATTCLPMRLLEVGASAGLNLRWDRYRYESDGFDWGDPAASVRLGFELTGPSPRATDVDVVVRRGCDCRPLDPLGEEGRLTLLSFVWADQPKRLQRLRAALAAAREIPLVVERAGAADWIAERLAERKEGLATVVFHSIVMQYLSQGERDEFERRLLRAGEAASERSPLAWLRMEPAGERAEVRLTCWPGGEDVLLARVGYHGDVLEMQPG
ncbi:MAG: DUF2332 domain-containing protein [Solirubrobacterales bacterium]